MPSYPSSLVVFTTKRNNIDIYDASHMNAVQDEIVAVETYLGISGSVLNTTVRFKLGQIADGDTAAPVTLSGTPLQKKTLIRPRIFPETQPNPPRLGNMYVDSSTNRLYYGNSTAWVPADGGIGRNAPITLTPSAAGTATLDLALSRRFRITMPAGNITIAITNAPTDGVDGIFEVDITQDSGGSRTVTWFSTIKWASGTVPTLTTTGLKRDKFVFEITGVGTYDGMVAGQNF